MQPQQTPTTPVWLAAINLQFLHFCNQTRARLESGSAGSAEAAVLHQLWREIRALLEAEAEAARAQAEKEVSEAQAAAEVVRAVRVEANGRFLEVLLSVSASASLC